MTIVGAKGNIKVSNPIGEVLVTASVYDTALEMPSFMATPPISDAATGIACVNTMHRSTVAFMFAGTDTADEYMNYHAVGVMPLERNGYGEGFIPWKVATGVATLGTTALGDYGIFVEASTSLIADTITETGSCPLSRVFSPAGNETAYLLIDCTLFQYVYVQVELGDCDTMDILSVTGDALAGGGAGGGPDTTVGIVDSGQTRINPAKEVDADLTYQTPVAINDTTHRTTLQANESGKISRLHKLAFTMSAAGTAKICEDTDGNGGSEADLTAAFTVAKNSGFMDPFTSHPDGCIKTSAVNLYLTMVTTTGYAHGYAICSKATS